MNYIKNARRVMLVMMLMAVMPSFAADIDVWTIGKIQAVVNKVEENAAGMVYASAVNLTSEDQIAAVEGYYEGEPVLVQGPAYSSDVQVTWYFYAKAKPGYKFVGFASSKTGTPSGSNIAEKLAKVGEYYTVSAKSGTPYSAYPETAPKAVARYAVFEKDANGGEGGEGNDPTTLTNIKAIGALYPKTVAETDAAGNTTGVVKYENLVGATLVANSGENFQDGDQVTHIYVKFDAELASISVTASSALASQLSLVNKTTGKQLDFSKYSCSVWSKDNTALDLMLSSENYINNADYQGVYEFKLPAGVVKSAKGAVNDAYEFTFTYGDPEQAKPETIINLEDYIGVWKQKKETGEQLTNPASFYVEKVNGEFFMTHFYGNEEILIPIVNNNNKFTLTETSSNGYSFGAYSGGAVGATFTENGSSKIIMLDQFKYVAPGQDAIVGGDCSFTRTSRDIPTAIQTVESSNAENMMFDLQGRRIYAPTKGIFILNGKKHIIK